MTYASAPESRLSLIDVRALHRDNHTAETIAHQLGTTPDHISRLLALTNDDLARLYASGKTIAAIADHLGVTKHSVYMGLRNANVALRPTGRRVQSTPEDTTARIVSLYQDGKTIREVADILGISRTRVHKILTEKGVPRRSFTRYTLMAPEEKTAILAAHAAGDTIAEIVAKTGRSEGGVRHILSAHGKTPNKAVSGAETNLADVVRLYREGMSLAQLSVRYNTSGAKITDLLKSQGVKIRPRGIQPGRGALPPLTDERRQEILAAYQTDETITSIVARLCVSHTTILKITDAAGIPRRHPGRPASRR